MAHYRDVYKFEDEASAKEFATRTRANKSPAEDLYVTGPIFMDENEIFRNMPEANTGKTWWQVTVESYS